MLLLVKITLRFLYVERKICLVTHVLRNVSPGISFVSRAFFFLMTDGIFVTIEIQEDEKLTKK